MRIIAGAAKGRRLDSPKGLDTRPMTDRNREAVFSAIASDLPDADVLDLYAGTGSMGLEALSRGAASAVFVERDRAAIAALTQNIEAVGLGGRARQDDVKRTLRVGASAQYDVVFVDPPYPDSDAIVQDVLGALVDWLRAGAVVVVHRRVGSEPPTVAGLHLESEKRYGTALIWRFRMRDARAGQDEENR